MLSVLFSITNQYVQSKTIMSKGILQVQNYILYNLENWNVVVDFSTVFLSHTFTYPNNVSAFLFLQLQVGVEDTKVELLKECIDIQAYLKCTTMVLLTSYVYIFLHVNLMWFLWICVITDTYLIFKESVFQSLITSIAASTFKECLVLSIVFSHSFHLLIVISPSKSSQSIRVQFTTTRIQLSTIILRQLSSK